MRRIEEAVKAADERTTENALNATDPNLRRFKARGAEADLYHGWTIRRFGAEYDQLFPKCSEQDGRGGTDAFARLYMAPGMLHCGGGPGPDSFGRNGAADGSDAQHNMGLALEQWVKKELRFRNHRRRRRRGAIPARREMTRPLCRTRKLRSTRQRGIRTMRAILCARRKVSERKELLGSFDERRCIGTRLALEANQRRREHVTEKLAKMFRSIARTNRRAWQLCRGKCPIPMGLHQPGKCQKGSAPALAEAAEKQLDMAVAIVGPGGQPQFTTRKWTTHSSAARGEH